MKCEVQYNGDYAIVTTDSKTGKLKLDLSSSYCRIFETSKQQNRDYQTEIIRWCGEKPENFDDIIRSIFMYVVVKRREIGMQK